MDDKQKINALGKALRKLSFAAQTTGGTAGPDKGLMKVVDHAGIVLDATGQAVISKNETEEGETNG